MPGYHLRIFEGAYLGNRQRLEVGDEQAVSEPVGACGTATLQAENSCFVDIGPEPTANDTGFYLAAGETREFHVMPGDRIAVVEA